MDAQLEALARRLGSLLADRGFVLATAESCTGGWIAQTVTAISGSSGWFDRGWITYSNEAKIELLGVQPQTLAAHGAVSEATAAEMAAGAVAKSRADVALSVTGVAGPSGGSAEKPVGTVCFGWCAGGRAPAACTRRFTGDRESVRRQAVVFALENLIARLEPGEPRPLAKSVP
jgi:nicotinamide-nucleotide amidase